ncbi:MAG: SRPBCC family protein [Solirubrobacterales bacterium]
MGPISLTTTIDAPRERVFDLIVDLARRPAWTDHFLSDYRLERIPPVGQGAAARFRIGAPGGITFMEMVISEAERPHRIAESGRGGRLDRVPCRALWELSEGPGGVTTVVFTFWTEPAARVDRLRELGRGGWWRRRWKRALRRLRELIESGSEGGAPRAEVAGADRVPAAPR